MNIDWSKSKEILGDRNQLEAVQQDGDALRYCHQPSEAVMLAAVQQDGYALQYFKRGWISNLCDQEVKNDLSKEERLQSLILKAADHIEALGDAMSAVLLREAAK